LAAPIKPSGLTDGGQKFRLEARLVSPADGTETPVPTVIRDLHKLKGHPDILVAELDLPDGIAPGDYRLVLSVAVLGTDRSADVSRLLTLR
jgi:hypothetical protein